MIKFEKVSKYKNDDIPLPERKTAQSAGYDFVVAADTLVPSYLKSVYNIGNSELAINSPKTIDEIKEYNKLHYTKLTLVPTGMKCYLEPDTYLELSVRSSTPLNTWLMLANGVGIIDADYADNPDNEGEIFFQLINFSPFDVQLKKGDIIGQGVIKKYLTTDSDCAKGARTGGFGSTNLQRGLRSQLGMFDEAGNCTSYYKPIEVDVDGRLVYNQERDINTFQNVIVNDLGSALKSAGVSAAEAANSLSSWEEAMKKGYIHGCR